MYPEELRSLTSRLFGGVLRLGFERGEEGLKPFEGGGVSADPDEFDAAETTRWVWARTEVVNIFEDGCPGSNTNTSADQHSDFVVKDLVKSATVFTTLMTINVRLLLEHHKAHRSVALAWFDHFAKRFRTSQRDLGHRRALIEMNLHQVHHPTRE